MRRSRFYRESRAKNQEIRLKINMMRVVLCRFLLLGAMVFTATSFKPVKGGLDIYMRIRSTWDNGNEDGSFYKIKGDQNKVTIDHFYVDSLYFVKMMTSLHITKRGLQLQDTTAEYYLRTKDSVAKLYVSRRYHKTVTVNAKQWPVYFKQIDSLIHTPKKNLLRKSPKYGGYLDGGTLQFKITANGVNRSFEATNPDENFAPTLANFLRDTGAFFYPAKK